MRYPPRAASPGLEVQPDESGRADFVAKRWIILYLNAGRKSNKPGGVSLELARGCLKGALPMIVRNVHDREVLETTYLAHGGAVAQMILDQRTLKEIGFLAVATLESGKTIEAHVDPMEEIYFILAGEGTMTVGSEKRPVKTRDAIWIPAGSSHSLTNSGKSVCLILVVASPNW
jgi:mannose-6-phosphate isomerase-like protein (cupin superfamily)